VQLVVLPLALLGLWALARAAGKVLLIFIVAAVIALILNPAVAFLQRSRLPRGVAVLAVYLAFFLALTGIGVLLANPISNQVRTFTHNLPTLRNEANKRIATIQRELDKQGIHLHLVKQGQTALQSIEAKITKSAGKLVSFGGALLTEIANAIFNLVLVFVLSVYMLLYGQRIGSLVRRVMPPGDGTRREQLLAGTNPARAPRGGELAGTKDPEPIIRTHPQLAGRPASFLILRSSSLPVKGLTVRPLLMVTIGATSIWPRIVPSKSSALLPSLPSSSPNGRSNSELTTKRWRTS